MTRWPGWCRLNGLFAVFFVGDLLPSLLRFTRTPRDANLLLVVRRLKTCQVGLEVSHTRRGQNKMASFAVPQPRDLPKGSSDTSTKHVAARNHLPK